VREENVIYDSYRDCQNSAVIRFCGMPINVRYFNRGGHYRSNEFMTGPRIFNPQLPNQPLNNLISHLSRKSGKDLAEVLKAQSESAYTRNTPWRLAETATLLILSDLANFGWKFKVVDNKIYMIAGSIAEENPDEAKAILRKTLQDSRSRQLAEKSTRTFLEVMHRPRTFSGRKVSIETLIDDGADLAESIRRNKNGDLAVVVDPYLQFVKDAKCEFTGLRLMDIWRYFRHTWSLEYRSSPGRSLCFLIRNRARKDHPVIGILGLANAVLQLKVRDDAIGWTPERVAQRIASENGYWAEFREVALSCLVEAKNNIRSDDLIGKVGKNKKIEQIIRRLGEIASAQQQKRKKNLSEAYLQAIETDNGAGPDRLLKKGSSGNIDWESVSGSPLFTRKRAETLASILFAEHVLKGFPPETDEFLSRVKISHIRGKSTLSWSEPELERAFKIAIRELKKCGLATRIMDVNVCGAVPSYREILGGKLAAYALFSEEIQKAYSDKYENSPSEIASAMAGRPIVKSARLALLTTTSLYSVGSSQYNRVRMRFQDEVVEWKPIGETEGFGTIHVTRRTLDALRELAIDKIKWRNVNNQFGEGTSPMMRQLREGLTILGFDANEVLRHSQRRLVYLLELYPGACEDLVLNRYRHPKAPSMEEVSRLWRDRWLSMRSKNEEVLQRLSQCSIETVKGDLGVIVANSTIEQKSLPYGER